MNPPIPPRRSLLRAALAALALAAAGLPLVSCQRVLPVRTLPGWVRGLYIPMVRNDSTEPGLEEEATRLAQEEFLADGRLNVVRKEDADLQLVVKILEYGERIEDTDSDHIPRIEEIIVRSEVKLYDPAADPLNPAERPVADLGEIVTRTFHNSDSRSVRYRVEPDVKRDAMLVLARQVVERTITGFPSDLAGAPPSGAALRSPGGAPADSTGSLFRKGTDIRP